MIRILQKNNRITKILFSVIIGAAIVSMCVYLIPGLMDNSSALNSGDVYATVQSPGLLGRFETPTSVKTAEVGQLAQRMLKQQRLPDFLLSYMLTRAGQMLVQQQVLVREADKLGLQVSNDDLAHELQHGPLSQYLFPKGQYIGDDAYMNFVQENFNLSRSEFESRIKLEMEITRLENLVTGGVTVGDAEVRSEYRKQSTKVKFSYVSIASDDVSKGITATDAELEAFFNQNKARYASAVPEARKLEYAAFDASSLPGGRPKVGADEVQQFDHVMMDQQSRAGREYDGKDCPGADQADREFACQDNQSRRPKQPAEPTVMRRNARPRHDAPQTLLQSGGIDLSLGGGVNIDENWQRQGRVFNARAQPRL